MGYESRVSLKNILTRVAGNVLISISPSHISIPGLEIKFFPGYIVYRSLYICGLPAEI